MSVNLDPEEIHKRILQKGIEWAKAKEQADLAEDAYKLTFQEQVQHFRNLPGEKVSVADAESRARITDEVVEAICKRSKMSALELEKKVHYDAAKIWFEALRTKAANLRQEMHTTGSTK